MGWPKILEDAKGVMYLNFYAYGVRSLSCDVDLAAAFSTTSLSELEQNYLSGLVVENNMSLFAENSEVFLFCLSILSADKTSKKIDRY